ncbi:MAG: hypothetical protein AVDCRST_MAG20-2308, partial [uncultured Acidimicrobiales bacterium]
AVDPGRGSSTRRRARRCDDHRHHGDRHGHAAQRGRGLPDVERPRQLPPEPGLRRGPGQRRRRGQRRPVPGRPVRHRRADSVLRRAWLHRGGGAGRSRGPVPGGRARPEHREGPVPWPRQRGPPRRPGRVRAPARAPVRHLRQLGGGVPGQRRRPVVHPGADALRGRLLRRRPGAAERPPRADRGGGDHGDAALHRHGLARRPVRHLPGGDQQRLPAPRGAERRVRPAGPDHRPLPAPSRLPPDTVPRRCDVHDAQRRPVRQPDGGHRPPPLLLRVEARLHGDHHHRRRLGQRREGRVLRDPRRRHGRRGSRRRPGERRRRPDEVPGQPGRSGAPRRRERGQRRVDQRHPLRAERHVHEQRVQDQDPWRPGDQRLHVQRRPPPPGPVRRPHLHAAAVELDPAQLQGDPLPGRGHPPGV